MFFKLILALFLNCFDMLVLSTRCLIENVVVFVCLFFVVAGFGYGKALTANEACQKAVVDAEKSMCRVALCVCDDDDDDDD
jgi:p-aminobenzoyl-glutamate transporter AbgT